MNKIFYSRPQLQLLLLGLATLAMAAFVVAGAQRGQAQTGPAPLGPYGPVYAQGRVSATSLNLRTGPHVSYTAVAYLMEGEQVQLVGRNRTGSWVQIELYNGYRGWVNASYIRPAIDIAALPIADVALWGITAFVTNDPIPVYTGADRGFGLVGWARPGDVLALNGRNDAATWVHVYLPDGRSGWARADSPFLPSASINDLPILTPFLDAPPPYLAPFFAVYTGPGFLYEPMDSVTEGQTLGIIGRTADNHWVQIRLPDGREGWIAAEIIHVSASIAGVPVVQGIAPPQVVGWQPTRPAAGQTPAATVPAATATAQPIATIAGGKTAVTPAAAATTTATPTDAPPTPKATATGVSTSTPAATPTSEATATSTATATDAPAATTTPAATEETVAVTPPAGLPIVYVYATPNDTAAPILRVVPGQSVVLIGRTAEADWVKIWLPGGQEGWIRAEALQLEIDISVLPIMES
ncbi:MAG: SH3 domain-containing protein [Candidatus Promineofilum sp.]|nr:SH3 domain-containing protein [Promineifilum sp.]